MSIDIEYKLLNNSESELINIATLLSLVFPDTNKFTSNYLNWLYRENPAGVAVGFNAFDAGALIGHYVCIPFNAMYGGKPCKGLLSLNTAVHPDYQGLGLFTKLAKRTYELAADKGFSFVCGVANGNSTHGFTKKLGFTLVAPMEAKVGLGDYYKQINSSSLSGLSDFYPLWTEEQIIWRSRNPHNSILSLAGSNSLVASTNLPFTSVIGKAAYVSNNIQLKRTSFLMDLLPKISIHLVPKGMARGGVYFTIPDKLKPSPLNFIFKNLTDANDIELPDSVFFNFVDFDAY